MTWFKDSSPLDATWFETSSPLELSDRVIVSRDTGSLFIRNPTESDEGGYHCVLENMAGTATSRVAWLTVTDPVTRESVWEV